MAQGVSGYGAKMLVAFTLSRTTLKLKGLRDEFFTLTFGSMASRNWCFGGILILGKPF